MRHTRMAALTLSLVTLLTTLCGIPSNNRLR